MTQELYWIYAFNLIINSLLTFLTMSLLIGFIILIFRIKEPRFKALLLCIPLIKLAIDPFLYSFHSWALMHQVNPLEAETGSRLLSVMVYFPTTLANFLPVTATVGFSINNDQTFSPADLIALTLSLHTIKGIVLITGIIAFALLTIYFIRLYRSVLFLSRMAQHAIAYQGVLQNQQLSSYVKRSKMQLIVSSDIKTPCAFGRKWICFPSNLIEKLSQAELEAIVAHEISHLLWYDGIFRSICDGLSILFWWVPKKWLLKRLEHNQEIACDTQIERFHINKLDLASAIIKTIRAEKQPAYTPLLSTCLAQRNLLSKRLQPLLAGPIKKGIGMKWLQISLAGFITLSFFLGKLWIF